MKTPFVFPPHRCVLPESSIPLILSLTSLIFLLAVPRAHAQVLDSDSDMLLDAWEIQHFGALNDPDGDATDDPDGDGCDNLAESNAGTDPNDATDCLTMVSSNFDPTTAFIDWPSVQGKRYHIQTTTDLSTWVTLSNGTSGDPLDFLGTGELLSADFNTPTDPVVVGGVTREVWFDASLTGNLGVFKTYVDNAGSPLAPDGTEWRPTLKGPSDYGSNYGARYRGFIVPKVSGDYNFYIAGRHQCEFWLDTTGDTTDGTGLARESYLNDQQLSVEEDWDYLLSNGLLDTQKSGAISLVAGQKYFFEIWHTHFGQFDHLAVGWELDDSGTIEVVPSDCLRPNVDFSDNNADPVLVQEYFDSPTNTQPKPKFARIITFGPLGPLGGTNGALDSDGDGVDDATEDALNGFNSFLTQSAVNGQGDATSLANAGTADPANDTITVNTTDGLGRENNGLIGTGIPRIKDVTRFSINRSGSLVPVTVYFNINGAVDPMAMGSPSASDFTVETPTGTPLPSGGGSGTYAATLPFGATSFVFEVNPVLDEIVEYPEELQVEMQAAPSSEYVLGTQASSLGTIHDARDDPEFNKYYIATFSKDDAAVTETSASGSTSLVLNGSNREATLNDFFENLTSPQTNTHVHKATLNANGITIEKGPIVESITDDGTETGTAIVGPVSAYTYLIEPRATFSTQDIINSLEFDNPKQGNPVGTTPLYDNKHSANNPSGEIWAIYRRQPASELSPEADDRIPPTPTITPIDPVTEPDKLRREIARFLTQATFGPTEADIEELFYQVETVHGGDRIAAYDAWITAQYALPQTLVRDLVLALDMQEFTLRGYFDNTRNGAAASPPVAPGTWPSFPSQDISNFDSLNTSTWQSPDQNYPLTAAQENDLDGVLGSPNHNNRRRAQWTVMAHGRDQLRQRVGFALGEILIISEELNNIRQHHLAAARWADMLAENADDHYREIIEDVTYSPLMGKYLSSLQNSSEASTGVPPDENYAREIMQLFTIGLLELWDDGFIQLDPTELNLLPTYTNDHIKDLARVMTGMSWSTNSASNTNWDNPTIDRDNPTSGWYNDGAGQLWYSSRYHYPMAFYTGEHDTASKTIAGDKVISNGSAASGRYLNEGDKDLRDVHNYFAGTRNNSVGVADSNYNATWSTDPFTNHQSTPAFVSRRLIQRLVTSNPSGPYIYRVAQAFRNSNGQIDEVVRAILLDPEARNLDTTELNPEFGKKKEPIVAWIQALRAAGSRSRVTFDGSVIAGDPIDFPGQTHNGTLNPTADGDLRNFSYPATEIAKFVGVVAYDGNGELTGGPVTYDRLTPTTIRVNAMDGGGTSSLLQTPLKAPTVFNWFLPDYQPGGLISSYGLFAPEFQITTESAVFQNINVYWTSHWGTAGFGGTTMGGNNANADLAGYGVSTGTGTSHSDDNEIPDYTAFINRRLAYTDDPGSSVLTPEQERDLQLIDDLDDLLFAGRYRVLYPIDPSDDGAHVTEGWFDGTSASRTTHPDRNPREVLLYYISDTYNENPPPSASIWNKVRAALYMMMSSPEYLIQK